MRTSNKYRNSLLLITLIVISFGCNTIDNTNVLGKWRVNKAALNGSELPTTNENNLQSELESMVFYFKDDGLLLYSNYYRTGAHGQWILLPEENMLTCTYQYERATYSDKFKIVQEDEFLKLYSSEFDGVNEIELTLERSTH